jgi:RHS repeat-associated protein
LPNGSYITNTYDNVARLTGTWLKNSSHSTLNSHQYTYNPGNQRTQQVFGVGSTYNYTYDAIGQLTFGDSATASEDRRYVYDAAWNLNYRTNNTTTYTFKVDTKNQLTNATPVGTQTYDGNGNVTVSGGINYTYDDENRLTAAANGTTWNTAFTYDGLGRLRQRIEYYWTGSSWYPNETTYYHYDGMRVIQERTTVPTVSYTRGTDLSGSLEGAGGIGGLLARSHGYASSNGNWYGHNFYHADGNGNITYLVNSSQGLFASYRYDPYGNTISSSGNSANVYRFSSKEIHVNSGLYYYGYRWYHPNLQRWLNRDPMGERYGPNLYVFCSNDSVLFIDPYGLYTFRELLEIIGSGIGGAIEGGIRVVRDPMNEKLGALWAGIGVASGGDLSSGHNATQVENHPLTFGGNITLGHFICYKPGYGPNRADPLNPGYTLGDHEEQHTYQYEELGPLFLPTYLYGAIAAWSGGGDWWADNPLEVGPNSSPPQPW